MPLHTQVRRNGEPLTIRWGGFHVACMVLAAAVDSGQGPWDVNTWEDITGLDIRDPVVITPRDVFALENYGPVAATPLGHDSYVLKDGPYHFIDSTDGEEFDLLPGDELIAFRG
jgi:hypothetical protein